MSELLWYVAHTKPRCEKKLAGFCETENIAVTLPCYESRRKYRGKSVIFRKPLFPGYVFVQLQKKNLATLRQNNLVANLLEVFDQSTLQKQLKEILIALEMGLVLQVAQDIGEGSRVRIKSGPLQGVEGLVEKRQKMNVVLLRLDFINQAAAVAMEADMVELI